MRRYLLSLLLFFGLAIWGCNQSAEIASKEALQTYLTSVSGDWTDPDPDDPEKTVAFDNAAHAKKVWDALDACNATL